VGLEGDGLFATQSLASGIKPPFITRIVVRKSKCKIVADLVVRQRLLAMRDLDILLIAHLLNSRIASVSFRVGRTENCCANSVFFTDSSSHAIIESARGEALITLII